MVIYANTHDPTGNTRYYQWKYNETWEYTGSEQSGYIWQGDSLAPRPLSAQIYICYHTDSSGNILIAPSDKLAQDVIYEHPLVSIGANTQPLGIEYSILVSQYALTDSAYNYLTLMQSNTEQLGSIFDPLPSQLVGNIHCLSDPAEPVVGYISMRLPYSNNVSLLAAHRSPVGFTTRMPQTRPALPRNTGLDDLLF